MSSFTNIWDVTFPPDTQAANQLGLDLRNFRLDTQQRMAAISGLSSAMPTFQDDAQPANWTGILFFATDTGHIFQFNGATWTDVTNDFIPAIPGTAKYVDDVAHATTGAGVGSQITIPANTLSAGSVIDIYFGATWTAGNPGFNLVVGNTPSDILGNYTLAAANFAAWVQMKIVIVATKSTVKSTFGAIQAQSANLSGPTFSNPDNQFDITQPIIIQSDQVTSGASMTHGPLIVRTY